MASMPTSLLRAIPAIFAIWGTAAATLQLPIWNWGAGYSKVKQADLRRQQAHVELSFAQRQLLANLRSFYEEARRRARSLNP